VVKGLVFLLFPACGFINGYCAARLYAFMHGVDWQLLWISTSVFFPFIFGLSMIAIDACEYIETGRVSALVLSEGFALGGVFALVNLPMTFIGTFIGYKRTPIQTPTKISRVPR
jgi:transmembrane 9 superfamily protein 2/4